MCAKAAVYAADPTLKASRTHDSLLYYNSPIDVIKRVMTMARTRVSPKYQVVIPKEIRERHGLRPGQELQVVSKGETITLVPDRPLSAFRGILRGMPTSGHREKKERM